MNATRCLSSVVIDDSAVESLENYVISVAPASDLNILNSVTVHIEDNEGGMLSRLDTLCCTYQCR